MTSAFGNSYMTRALRSSDPRYLSILQKLGYPLPGAKPSSPAPAPEEDDAEQEALTAAREEYERVVGKRPYHAWDAAELRRRIAEHLAAQTPPAPDLPDTPEPQNKPNKSDKPATAEEDES